MGCCSPGSARKESEEQEQNKGEKKPLIDSQLKPPPKLVSLSLEVDNNLDVREPLPPVYYVIIGRGPMAIVNHRTLVQCEWGKTRLKQKRHKALPVLHIGFPNPWPKYLRHGLGQPNHLLSFPGLHNQPSENAPDPVDGGLDSQHFGRQFDEEFKLLETVKPLEGWVALIQTPTAKGTLDVRIAEDEFGGEVVSKAITEHLDDKWPPFKDGEAPYRLLVIDAVKEEFHCIYAAAIDICTGPGRPLIASLGKDETEEVALARTPPWAPPEAWSRVKEWRERRIMNGVDAIRDEVEWLDGERVCITGGGGVGLNGAEKARKHGCPTDWFGRTSLNVPPIFGNPRNITFLQNPNTQEACKPGNLKDLGIDSEDQFIAAAKFQRMGRGATMTKAANTKNGVEVWLAEYGSNGNVIRDWWGKRTDLNTGEFCWKSSSEYESNVGQAASRKYDRLVIPNAQGTSEVGQPTSFAAHLTFTAVKEGGRMVALATGDGLVRILGAACNDYPGKAYATRNNLLGGTPEKLMWDYHENLPVSAVPDGFIICGANTALANHYFDDFPNENVNTMTLTELQTLLQDDEFAAKIVANRKENNGFLDINDLKKICGNGPNIGKLKYAYPAV